MIAGVANFFKYMVNRIRLHRQKLYITTPKKIFVGVHMIESAISGFIVGLTLLIGAYVIIKRYVEGVIFEYEERAISWIQSEDAAKLIYQIGGIIGNGAKAGIGLKGGSGKFRWQDMLGQIIVSRFAPSLQGENPELPQQNQNTENLKFKY